MICKCTNSINIRMQMMYFVPIQIYTHGITYNIVIWIFLHVPDCEEDGWEVWGVVEGVCILIREMKVFFLMQNCALAGCIHTYSTSHRTPNDKCSVGIQHERERCGGGELGWCYVYMDMNLWFTCLVMSFKYLCNIKNGHLCVYLSAIASSHFARAVFWARLIYLGYSVRKCCRGSC